MLMTTSGFVSLVTFLRSFSISAPFLPMTTPGRADCTVTRHFLCGRSMTIFDTAACLRSFISSSRIFMSSWSNWPYSSLPEYQRESQVRLMPSRKPIGLTFCPICYLSRSRGLDLTHHDGQVRERLENPTHAAAAARVKALDHDRLADMRLGDDEIVDVEIVIVLGVGDRRFQALANVARDALAREFEIGQRGRHLLAADELRH